MYPIYYSDTPYDATSFAKLVMLRKIAETTKTQVPPELYAGIGSGIWEQERTSLIKKECHKYDEEWRMVTGCIMKPPIMMEWIPSGIILGLRMEVAEENLVVSKAKEAGIKNIFKSYIDTSNRLNAFNIALVLSATLFHPMSEHMQAVKVGQKHTKVVKEGLFKKVFIMAIQKETFDTVYDFLENEANDEV